jgi:hypothetical protein
MINRDVGIHVPGAAVTNRVFTCSTGDLLSGAALNGRVVDRLGLGGNRIYENCEVAMTAQTTVGSTAADKKITLSVKLQHGDSSGGGDMADYSTGQTNPDQSFWTTAESTAYQNWSTGVMAFAHQSWYNIIPAKRYIRGVGVATKGGTTTSTAAGTVDQVLVDLNLTFRKSDVSAPQTLSTSTSTSTST